MKKGTGGPAFPQDYEHTKVLVQMQQIGDISVEQLQQLSRQLAGMSLRDYFAAKALQGLLAEADCFWDDAAPLAYQYADAMLKARESK